MAGSASPTSPRGTRTPKRAEAAIIGRKRLVARQREMQYNAGVLKTFDEIIVNSVDRQVEVRDMSMIEVKINRKTGELSVWNDGPGIEPVPHKSGKGLVPEVAFGEFMASTNFDDNTRKRFTGGRFGVGAKATNAWSKSFCVRTFHAKSGLFYQQTWSDNMVRPAPRAQRPAPRARCSQNGPANALSRTAGDEERAGGGGPGQAEAGLDTHHLDAR